MKKLFLFIFVFIIYFSWNIFASVSSVSEWSVSGSSELGDVWMCAMLYEPVCWEIETCWVNPSINWVQNEMCRIKKVQKTFSNSCEANNAFATILYKWECWKINEPVACTMEVKMCSDGVTYVWRTWPKCEFEKCPYVLPEKTIKKLDILIQKILDKAIETEKKWTMRKTEFISKIMDKLIIINNEKPKMTKLVDYVYHKLQDENNTISSSTRSLEN